MVVVWFIILLVSIYGIVVVAGPFLLRLVITIPLAIIEPFKELVRLYKTNQKRKALTMTIALSWLFVIFPLLLWLVHLATS